MTDPQTQSLDIKNQGGSESTEDSKNAKRLPGDKKISLPEAILMVTIAVVADILELILVAVGGDWGFIDTPVLLIIQFWLFMKGARWAWALTGNLLEFIPFLTALPIRTVTLLITIYITNHPNKTGLVGILGKRGVGRVVE